MRALTSVRHEATVKCDGFYKYMNIMEMGIIIIERKILHYFLVREEQEGSSSHGQFVLREFIFL